MISPLPGVTPLVPGSCTLPLPGNHGGDRRRSRATIVPNGQGGILVVKRPWPAMIRTIWGDPERYKKSYYPEELGGKLYLAGDGSVRDKTTGYFTIMGRIDDVLNVSGHRMGTMEIESALVANPIVAEAAVVGRPDDLTGEAICAFVVLKQARPIGCGRGENREATARLGRQGNRSDRETEGHPLRRQSAEDAIRQDHAAAAAVGRQGRGHHAGHFDTRESGDSRTAQAGAVGPNSLGPRWIPVARRRSVRAYGGGGRSRRTRAASPACPSSLTRFGYSVAPVDGRMAQVEVAERAARRDVGERVRLAAAPRLVLEFLRQFLHAEAGFSGNGDRSSPCSAVSPAASVRAR